MKLTKKLNTQTANVVLARDVSTEGHKEYLGFQTVNSAMKYVSESAEKHYYEVLRGYNNRKLYFDFDNAVIEGNTLTIEQFISDFIKVFTMAILALFNIDIMAHDIVFTDSSTDTKNSYHISVPNFNTTVDNMKLLHALTARFLTDVNIIYSNEDGSSCLDKAVYGTNQCFRMLGSCKKGKTNLKKLYTSSCMDESTLIGIYIDDESEEIFLTQAIQDRITANDLIKESRQFETIKYNSDVFLKIVMNLSMTRTENYDDWFRVCLALGHEKAGLNVANEFSKRSPKFNPVMTESLYNKGLNGVFDTGRPITVGSLLAMLKEDNIDVFHEIIGLNKKTSGMTHDEIKEMIDNHAANEKVVPDETQEEKLKRWLSNKEYSFYHKVSNPRNSITKKDNKKIYNAKHMKNYPKNAKTMIIKAEKGTGKTYQLEQYIKKHNPEYAVFVSFRKTLSTELLKRMTKHGFINYLDIKGAIDSKHKRVIIQVESLPRLKWNRKADLIIGDEIESIRNQFFSETCRNRNACIEKWEMLINSSEQAILMDADISENTIKHIREVRKYPIHYIENTYKLVQSQFKEFYSTKQNRIFKKLCYALDKDEKIVIACNRSVSFMEALRLDIIKLYPEIKILLINKHINKLKDDDPAKAECKPDNWRNYDIVMYSPTISAGVSVEYEYFDKFFGFFNSAAGKVNSLRQMVNRVRNFKVNEFYYCLETYGGSNKPQNVAILERHIQSTRFIDKPEFILSREKYDGTREYPYKNAGYWLWIYNEIETARDRSLFIFNFLREQYHSGVMCMRYLEDDVSETLTEESIKETTKLLKRTDMLNIVNAEPITEQQRDNIRKRIDEEKDVSQPELHSLTRKNLLDTYKLPEQHINELFVKTYSSPVLKRAFRNREALKQGVRALCAEEGRTFNGLFMDMSNVQNDLNHKYIAVKCVIATEFIKICGFDNIYSQMAVSKETIEKGFKKNKKAIFAKLKNIYDVMDRDNRSRKDPKKWTFQSQLQFINSILIEVLQINIKETVRRSGEYYILGTDLYDFENKPDLFCEIL